MTPSIWQKKQALLVTNSDNKKAVYFAELTGYGEIKCGTDHIDKILELIQCFNTWLFGILGRGCGEEVGSHLRNTPFSL